MKIIIFAGGSGTRLWPISRDSFPKQFQRLFDGKSTLELAVQRIRPVCELSDIYISTNEKFKDIVLEQIPGLPEENLILEPSRRDLAPAILLALLTLKNQGYTGPMAILWADHVMEREPEFATALKTGEQLILENPNRFIYMGEQPRFANNNLGWIQAGEEVETREGFKIHEYKSWVYHPEMKLCEKMFKSDDWRWNPGYFITSVSFVLGLYQAMLPEMYSALSTIDISDKAKLNEVYSQLEVITFDNGILEKTKPEQAIILFCDLGWSDPGTLYAMKETLQESNEANVTEGLVVDVDSQDSLIWNSEPGKLVTAVGLKGMVIVNTPDALLVIHKDDILRIKELIKKLKENGQTSYT